MPRASWSDLADIEIEIPPLPEQKKIAEILSGIDYLLKAKEAKVKKTRLLLKYTIEDATRKSATGEAVPLKEFGEWKGGGTPSKSVSEYWNGEIPWVSPKDMKEQRISTSQDKITEAAIENSATSLVTRGSILFVVRSGILRHTLPMALAARDVAINQDLKALTVNESCNVNFLFHYLSCKSDEILASCMKSGTTVESIDTNSLQNYEVPTLSPEIQAQLSLFAEGITKTCEGEESQIRSLKMLKSAISSDLLSGRKRVSV
jgi:type I restriction enzyme S subunit